MEIKEIKAMVSNPVWLKVEQLLQENPQDITGAGGGNIGVGGVPQPGETGYTERTNGTTRTT